MNLINDIRSRWRRLVHNRTIAKVTTEEELSKYPRNEGYEQGGANTWSSAEVLPTKASNHQMYTGDGLYLGLSMYGAEILSRSFTSTYATTTFFVLYLEFYPLKTVSKNKFGS